MWINDEFMRTLQQEYALEYGTDSIEMHTDALQRGEKVLIVDDLIATGGTAEAACRLIEQLQGEIVGCAFMINLSFLPGKKNLESRGRKVFSLLDFEE